MTSYVYTMISLSIFAALQIPFMLSSKRYTRFNCVVFGFVLGVALSITIHHFMVRG